MNHSLYQLVEEFKSITTQLKEMELDQETLKDTLDSLQLPIEQKVENIIKYMKSLEALAEAKKLEAKRLSESASSDLKKVDFFKNYLSDNLTAAGIKNLQAGVFEVKFRKGSEVVQVVDENLIPEIFFEPQPPKLMSKTDLKKYIKENNIEVPGVQIVRNPDSLVVK